MTHVHKAKQLGVYGKDLVHNPDDKSFEGFIPEEQPYQIDFLDDFEIEYCKKFYYDRVTSEVVQLNKSHFFLVYPLNYPELREILIPKLDEQFGKWFSYSDINNDKQKQSSDFYFWQQGIFAPHTDSLIHIPGYVPYKDVLIPLEMEGGVDSPYYTFNQRWYGRGCHFKYKHIDNMFALYSDIMREKPYGEYKFFKNYESDPDKMISKDWYDEYFGEIYNYEMLQGFSLNKMLPWTPGRAIVTDSSMIHGATNYKIKGGKYKLGITLRLFKNIPEYKPSTVFSVFPQMQGFSECKADPRMDENA